jgi:endonuclease-3
MARETQLDKQKRAVAVFSRLDAAMPEAKIELDYKTPLELLVSVILSAQSTDRGVNLATPALFSKYKTAADYAAATPEAIQPFIKTLGLFRNKSKSLVNLGRALVETHGGVVPITRAQLATLPGVGPKTAGVVSMHLKGDEAFPVDTHILRLSVRLGFSTHTDPDEVEEDLQRLFPPKLWFQGHQVLIWHGRRVCHARSPECHRCVVETICPKRGVKKAK